MGCCSSSTATAADEWRDSSSRSSSSGSADSGRECVDLNAASAEELRGLPGIGKARAEAIVSHRQRHGPFASPEALAGVPQVGAGTVERLRGLVVCGGQGPAAGARVSKLTVPAKAHEVVFFPDDKARTNLGRVLAALGEARKSLDVAVFSVTQEDLAAALLAARRRGVAVRLLTDDEREKEAASRVPQLRREGVPVLTDTSERLHMHHKFAVIDGKTVLHGSFNWTKGAVVGGNENVIISRAPALAQPFSAEFERLWAALSRGDPGKSPSVSKMQGNTAALFFPDAAGCNAGLIRGELETARRSIDVAMFTLTRDDFVEVLLAKHRQGVVVRVITDDRQAKVKGADAQRIAEAGIEVRMDKTWYAMHHKFAVIDGSTLINGSFNWTRQAAEGNQEDVVIMRDASALARQFTQEFERMWAKFGA